jgi:hypothetical protein
VPSSEAASHQRTRPWVRAGPLPPLGPGGDVPATVAAETADTKAAARPELAEGAGAGALATGGPTGVRIGCGAQGGSATRSIAPAPALAAKRALTPSALAFEARFATPPGVQDAAATLEPMLGHVGATQGGRGAALGAGGGPTGRLSGDVATAAIDELGCADGGHSGAVTGMLSGISSPRGRASELACAGSGRGGGSTTDTHGKLDPTLPTCPSLTGQALGNTGATAGEHPTIARH